MIPSLGEIATIQGALGIDSLKEIIPNANGTLPIASLFAIWLIGGRVFRLTAGLLPVLITVLFMLGADPETARMLSTGSSYDLQSFPELNSGWLTTGLVVLGALYLLGGRRLFSLPSLIAAGAIIYLLNARDFRLSTLLNYQGSTKLLYCLVAAALLLLGLRIFSRSRFGYFNPYAARASILRPMLMYSGGVLAVAISYLILTNPSSLEHWLPGWRSGVGIASLLVTICAFVASLPQRWRGILGPLFWSSVALIIGFQIFTSSSYSQTTTQKPGPEHIESF